MSRLVSNRRLAKALMDRGLIPTHCRLIDVQIDVDGALTVRYERYIDVPEMALFAEALAEVAAEMTAEMKPKV